MLVVALELVVVQQRQRFAGIAATAPGERERPGERAQLTHRGSGADAPPGHVADDDSEAAVRHRERVVPVPAHLRADTGDVVGRDDVDTAHLREALRDQPTLELDRDPVLLLVQLRAADRQRGAVGRVLEQRALGGAERPSRRLREAHVADFRPLDHERYLAPPVVLGSGRRARDRADLPARGAHHARLVVLAIDLHLGRLDPEQLGQPRSQLRQELIEIERARARW